MKMENGRYVIFDNTLSQADSRKATAWQEMFVQKFNYNKNEKYELTVKDNPYLGSEFGLKDILRGNDGGQIQPQDGVIISTIRMGFGHYRIAMAGASAACAMGFTPYWLDLLAIPGHHHGRDQLVQHVVQPLVPHLSAQPTLQQVCLGVGHHR
jgi:hypothetical protein